MGNSYKHGNGRIAHRSGNGRFRKTTMEDMGINDANKEGIVFVCNVCGREFVPVILSGKCCGVEDKRRKVIEVTPEQQGVINKIEALKKQPFVNRKTLQEIQELEIILKRITPHTI